jgi:hypothetical protein
MINNRPTLQPIVSSLHDRDLTTGDCSRPHCYQFIDGNGGLFFALLFAQSVRRREESNNWHRLEIYRKIDCLESFERRVDREVWEHGCML